MTAKAFLTESKNIERTLQARVSYNQRHPRVAASMLLSGKNDPGTLYVRETIREFVRDEL